MKQYIYNDAHCPLDSLPPDLRAVNPVCLDILYRRGFTTPEQIRRMLFPSLAEALEEHPELLDLGKAVDILKQAAARKLPVAIYHDYDADGITAAAVAMTCLQNLEIPVHLYCNSRTRGGFGIKAQGVDELMERYPDTRILLTVDNGISGFEGVARAKSRGLTVIVTDHHEADSTLPGADAVVDHKRKDEPPEQDRSCCGAGVIWKVMLALYGTLGRPVDDVMETLDLVALGTIADVVPLLGDNRALVKEGMRYINDGRRPFFRVFSEVTNLQKVDSEAIAFKLAPMINAVSRMDREVEPVVRLLLSDDEGELRTQIGRLLEINKERKDETDREVALASAAVERQGCEGRASIVFRDESLREGIVGIVAGRLKETYQLPSAVFARGLDGSWKGSARSLEDFHLKHALDQCARYLTAYGGHAKAAGLTVRDADFDAFCEKFEALSQAEMAKTGYIEKTAIDARLSGREITVDLIRDLEILEPFGEGFRPLLMELSANTVRVQYMGENGKHVKYFDDTGLAIIQWNKGDEARARSQLPTVFLGHPSINVWNGMTSAQFMVE